MLIIFKEATIVALSNGLWANCYKKQNSYSKKKDMFRRKGESKYSKDWLLFSEYWDIGCMVTFYFSLFPCFSLLFFILYRGPVQSAMASILSWFSRSRGMMSWSPNTVSVVPVYRVLLQGCGWLSVALGTFGSCLVVGQSQFTYKDHCLPGAWNWPFSSRWCFSPGS